MFIVSHSEGYMSTVFSQLFGFSLSLSFFHLNLMHHFNLSHTSFSLEIPGTLMSSMVR